MATANRARSDSRIITTASGSRATCFIPATRCVRLAAGRGPHSKGNAPSTIRFPTVNNGAGRGLRLGNRRPNRRLSGVLAVGSWRQNGGKRLGCGGRANPSRTPSARFVDETLHGHAKFAQQPGPVRSGKPGWSGPTPWPRQRPAPRSGGRGEPRAHRRNHAPGGPDGA